MIYHLSVKIVVTARAFRTVVCAQLSCGVKGHLIYGLTPAILVRAVTAGMAEAPRSRFHQRAISSVIHPAGRRVKDFVSINA